MTRRHANTQVGLWVGLAALTLILTLSPATWAKTFYFWTGAVSSDPTDPNNWDSDNPGGMPTGTDNDIALIGVSSAWQLVTHDRQPVLTSPWVNNNGDPNAGWWLINGVGNQNSLTIDDGGFIKFTHNDCNLRNGALLRVSGRGPDGGPSLIIAPRFRIGQQGNNPDTYPDATSTLRVDDDGYLRFDPAITLRGSGGDQIYLAGEINALIEIRDNGILEMVAGQVYDGDVVSPRFVFASTDPNVNRIVISGNGQLIVPSSADTALVGEDEAETPLQDLIDMGLIASGDEGVDVVINGDSPAVIQLAGQRVSAPSPADGTPDADRKQVLSWDPGTLADAFDVYLGTDRQAVETATREQPQGVLQAMDLTESRFPTDSALVLEYGQTYYWRVDEVITAGSQTIQSGDIWTFTVEPYAIALPASQITVTASSASVDQGPEKVIDGSGLDANDLHSNDVTDMWLSDVTEPNQAWIRFDFDQPVKLHELVIWNYNGPSIMTGLGIQDVNVEISPDGVTSTVLGPYHIGQASGQDGSGPDTSIPMQDLTVKSLTLRPLSNYGNNPLFNKVGLSEIRFLHVPVAARSPEPADGATGVALDSVLSWRAGREAAEHQVYLSADEQAVLDGTAPVVAVTEPQWQPALALGQTLYWRVDEVNTLADPAVWAGPVWSFSTVDTLVVDDFESYTNESPDRVFQIWLDGLGFSADEFYPDGYAGNGTGAIVGYDPVAGPIMETGIVHGGRQAMPLAYDSTSTTLSQTDRAFATAQDWAAIGATQLVLHIYGQPGNTGQLYVKINDTQVLYDGPAETLTTEAWTAWTIDLAATGVSLDQVTSLSIGVEGAGASGLLFVDDILLQ